LHVLVPVDLNVYRETALDYRSLVHVFVKFCHFLPNVIGDPVIQTQTGALDNGHHIEIGFTTTTTTTTATCIGLVAGNYSDSLVE